MIPFNYHHLYYFYVIAKSGSISKACEELFLAQPTLSMQLKQFEKSTGQVLFERRKQRLFLTEAGRLILDYAESIFEMGKEMQDALKDRALVGQISAQLGVLNGTPRSFAHALIECALKEMPNAFLSVREGTLESLANDLQEHKIDAILSDISVQPAESADIVNHLVARVPIVFSAAPKQALLYKKLPQDFEGAPFILPSFPSQIYHQVLDTLAQWKVKPKIMAEVQDVELGRRLAIHGHGILPVNAYTVAMSQPKNSLSIIGKNNLAGIFESVYLITRKRKWTNPVIEFLIKNFRLSWPYKVNPSPSPTAF